MSDNPQGTVYTGARVITADDRQPAAEAFWVRNGRFEAVGSRDEVLRRAGASVQEVSLDGRTVVPGFIDAHLHIMPLYHAGSRHEVPDVGPSQTPDMEALIARMQERARTVPPGEWVIGRSYQETKLGRHPTREDLDRISTRHPVRLHHSSFHVSCFNSMALRNAGITRDTPDPPGGSFDRDADGEPNGIVREEAQALVMPQSASRSPEDNELRAHGLKDSGNKNPPMAMPTHEEMVQALHDRLMDFASRGITSIGIAGISPADYERLRAVRDRGCPVRVYAMFFDHYLADAAAIAKRDGLGDERLKIGGIKVFHGHSLSGLTAWVTTGYAGRRNYFGIPPKRTQAELDELVKAIQDNGFQAAIHANGDREIDMVLTAYERVLEGQKDRRHRIEHASITTDAILQRAKDSGTVLVFHSYMYEHGDKIKAFGEERLAMMHPHRTALDMGVKVAGHSDWPVSAAEPLLRVEDLVRRCGADGTPYGPQQCISPAEALSVMTLGGAYANHDDQIKGSITEGKLADFVVLGRNPLEVAPDTIKDVPVVATYVGGARVWAAA